ncbi:MAG: RnfABCDGE type electron transport complex subunit D [Actinobacteria bacterium]|nr:RnfABCDGE type electron transport complex subunit D [Actinomycetota bacterium]
MANHDLVVTAPPHIKGKDMISTGMRDVAIALIPLVVMSLVFFRLYALVNLVAAVATALACEYVMRKMMGREPTLGDYSAVVTGLLLALILPPTVPFWWVMIGVIIAVAIVKELMGGLGVNLFNPALFGFVSLIIISRIFGPIVLGYSLGGINGVTSATPLTFIKGGALNGLRPGYWNLFLAHGGGALGEVSVLAVLVGAAYLLYKGHITWHIPASIIGTVFVLSAILGENPLYMILAGGVMLGSFFMATDWVTSPDTRLGQVIYGVLIGVLIVVMRLYAAPTGAVAYSILIGNAVTPLLNRLFVIKRFGAVKSVS